MITSTEKLYVFHDDDGVFSDLSQDSADFTRDNYNLQLTTADYLYVGYFKPFSTFYLEMVAPNASGSSVSWEYYDGTSWVPLAVSDDTKSMTRSGFTAWAKSVMRSTTINGQEGFFVRASVDVDTDDMTLRGLNLVFSDDAQMKQSFFEVDNENVLPPGETSHIVHHVAARNYIVQRLTNLGYVKYNSEEELVSMTYWDLHEISEIRQAATQLALSKVFFNLSDSPEDQWWSKYREYQDNFEEAFKMVRLSFDRDNDGTVDDEEKLEIKKVTRWVR